MALTAVPAESAVPVERGMTKPVNVKEQLTLTFVVTKECNFRCRYCYMVHKNNKSRMAFEIAKSAIDYLVENPDQFPQTYLVCEFIGGEPLLEIDLIEQICNYIKLKTWEHTHPWFTTLMFSLSTNGALYDQPKVQALLNRYKSCFDMGITIDGPAHVHDLERQFPDGQGTHAAVVKNIPLWLSRTTKPSTKVTISHDNLPFLAESVLYLFSLGIPVVNANVVFENVWQPGDDVLLETQLDILGDTMLEQELWRKHECSFFNRIIGDPLAPENDNNWCGAGRYMLAVDDKGLFYPCVRFTDFSLTSQPAFVIGDVERGIDWDKLTPFYELNRSCQSTCECMDCEVASGCAWCQGFNYDDSGMLAHRATYICKMHKARVSANKRFWARLDKTLANGESQWKQAAAK